MHGMRERNLELELVKQNFVPTLAGDGGLCCLCLAFLLGLAAYPKAAQMLELQPSRTAGIP